MKKIAMCLVLVFIICFTSACFIQSTSEATISTTKVTEEAVSGQIEYFPELSYKMAPVYKKLIEVDGENVSQLWFVLEMSSQCWDISDLSSLSVVKDGVDVKLSIFPGSICIENHYKEPAVGFEMYGYDIAQYTVCVESTSDLDFEDLSVSCDLYYSDKDAYMDSQTYILSFNADISEVTTRQGFIHSNTLFEINNHYYVCNNYVGGVGGDNSFSYNMIGVVPINCSMKDLIVDLSGNVTLVYGPSAFIYENIGYSGIEDYMKAAETPDKCELYISECTEGIRIGYKTFDGYILSEVDKDKQSACVPVYTYEDGFEMAFMN